MVVLQSHSDQQQGQLFNLPEHPSLVFVALGAQALLDEVDVGLVDVVGGNEVHFELEDLQEFHLAGQDLFLRKSSVRDLLRHHLRMERVNVFVLRREVHGADSDQMHV